ncbi:HOPM interactor 7 isoform 1 [Hibiscus syriacus]|uniref:HOPM interactor 7 isoform 1 n=2 Tax=Hibiscus syriacus TaxID=106335 RepID=A0A6A2YAN0_HIBSY|nr:HOPM interactor 7 isoform 1 [Hibiscus syriacus]
MIRDNLALTTFGDAKERMPWVSDTCAVCLSDLEEGDDVRELRNCCHVFHQDCIDRWVDHDHDHHDDHDHNHSTCPLCRSPLVTSSQSLVRPNNEPSWAVDRLLYLFGDDLLP